MRETRCGWRAYATFALDLPIDASEESVADAVRAAQKAGLLTEEELASLDFDDGPCALITRMVVARGDDLAEGWDAVEKEFQKAVESLPPGEWGRKRDVLLKTLDESGLLYFGLAAQWLKEMQTGERLYTRASEAASKALDEIERKKRAGEPLEERAPATSPVSVYYENRTADCDPELESLLARSVDHALLEMEAVPMEPDTSVNDPSPAASAIAAHGMNKGSGTRVRVKGSSESYDCTKSALRSAKTGQPLRIGSEEIRSTSQWEMAKAGSFLKHIARRAGVSVDWTEHDAAILAECAEKDAWAGEIGGVYHSRLDPGRVKAILSDLTSGGAYISPEWFDNAIVVPALLTGEIVPWVETVDVSRGSSVEGGTISHPQVVWGHTEGSAGDLFDTNSLIGSFNTPIRNVSLFIKAGLDFMSDAAVDLGTRLVSLIAEKLGEELDRIIVVGNGTTEPKGLLNSLGVTVITAANGTSGPMAIADLERLLFGTQKQYRTSQNNPVFISSDEQYRRVRAVPVGTSDARRVFGMDHSSYKVLDFGYKINNSVPEGTLLFCALRRYRLYRRLGTQIKWETAGETLTRENCGLLAMRARYGGQLTIGATCSKMTSAAQTG